MRCPNFKSENTITLLELIVHNVFTLGIALLVYVIGGSVVLFGKNRVLKFAVVNKIVRA